MYGRKVNQDDQTWINNDCGSTWAWGEMGCAAMESLALQQVWGVGEHQILTLHDLDVESLINGWQQTC
jgi:hypothetical protein